MNKSGSPVGLNHCRYINKGSGTGPDALNRGSPVMYFKVQFQNQGFMQPEINYDFPV